MARHSSRPMSRPNRDKALAKIEEKLIEIVQASPKFHPSRREAPIQVLPMFHGSREWHELVKCIGEAWSFRKDPQ